MPRTAATNVAPVLVVYVLFDLELFLFEESE